MSDKQTDLAFLMEYIGERHQFTPENYSHLWDHHIFGKDLIAFALKHSVFHMQKALGKLAAVCEAFDHNGKLNDVVVREAVAKMFISTLKLAEEMNISPEELAKTVPEFMTSK